MGPFSGNLLQSTCHVSQFALSRIEPNNTLSFHPPFSTSHTHSHPCPPPTQPPVVALRSRLRHLLTEWPDHPLLTQLEQLASRILSLPARGPLKAALTGAELLLSRSQTWEEGASSAVSLKALLSPLAALAMRWRRAELAAWPRALAAAAREAARRADGTWFPLFRLLSAGAGEGADAEAQAAWLPGVASALEEYLRGSPLGEYERRLALLWGFHRWAVLKESGVSGSVGGGERRLAWLLYNTHRYYAQFSGAVRGALAAAGAPIATKLREHVRLAKWEVRCVDGR